MKIKEKIAANIQFLRKTFQYPEAYKQKLADRNVRHINFIVSVFFFITVFGVFAMFRDVIPGTYREEFLKIYYSIFLMLDISSFAASFIAKRKKVKSVLAKQLVVNAIVVGYVLLFSISIFFSTENILINLKKKPPKDHDRESEDRI